MMLGDRGRGRLHSFRRTTSVSLLSVDVSDIESPQHLPTPGFPTPRFDSKASAAGSGDFRIETAHFLETCGFCNRNLAPSSDIFMYRGDTAFCSLECREHQMKQDEVNERYAASSFGGGYRPEVVAVASDKSPTVVAA